MSAAAAPRFLFVPVSGPGGAGEYFRSLAIARGLEARWPAARIRFVLNRQAPYAANAPYPVLWVDDSPTRSSDAVVRYLREESPDVVVFDSSGRLAQYRAAREVGARVVYVSSRPKTRWKGFRWRRMRALDQHWIANPAYLGGTISAWERLKLRLVRRPELLQLDSLHEVIDGPAVQSLQHRLGLEPGRYVVMCPGGGGMFDDRPDAAPVFREAAVALGRRIDVPVVLLAGRRLMSERVDADPAVPARVHVLDTVTNGVLVGLLQDAALAIVNGGSLMLQACAQCVPVIAAPIARDQDARIARSARLGLVRAARLEAADIAQSAQALLADEHDCEAMRARQRELGLRNGVPVAAEAVERLLATVQGVTA